MIKYINQIFKLYLDKLYEKWLPPIIIEKKEKILEVNNPRDIFKKSNNLTKNNGKNRRP